MRLGFFRSICGIVWNIFSVDIILQTCFGTDKTRENKTKKPKQKPKFMDEKVYMFPNGGNNTIDPGLLALINNNGGFGGN